MSEEEIRQMQPSYIVLDEFHRCGVEMWGLGVQELLATYKNIPVLGLFATAIRYLDNQRNMADEIFGGKIASEMTLDEAIVHGVLSKPMYIISMYSYQKELEKYERKIKKKNIGLYIQRLKNILRSFAVHWRRQTDFLIFSGNTLRSKMANAYSFEIGM